MPEFGGGLDGRLWKRLKHLAGQAIHNYDLIRDGDVIAAAISGGKDSLLMLHFLAELKRRAPVNFELGVFHLGSGETLLRPWLRSLNLNFIHLEAAPPIKELAEYQPGGPSPCFACARVRRNRLFELSRSFGATSLALGHHLDDAAETLLMNIFYSGRLEGLEARQNLFEGRLKLIRPLFLVPEKIIAELCAVLGLPVFSSGCPADGLTMRQKIKELVAGLVADNPKVAGNLAAVVMAGTSAAGQAEKRRFTKADAG